MTATTLSTTESPQTPPGGEWPRQKVLRRALALLDEAAIPYCVLNGYERLYAPEGMGEGDLDCVIAPDAVPERVASLLHANAARLGADLVGWEGAPNHYIMLAARERGELPFLAQLDLHPGYERHGRRFFSAREVLRGRRRFGDVWIPAPDVEFAYYLVKKMMGGSLEERQTRQLTQRFARDPDGCACRLASLWGDADARLIENAARSGSWERVVADIARLRAALLRRYGRRRPLLLLRARAAGITRRVRRLGDERRGLHIVLLGPDGAGKTTVIDALAKLLAPMFVNGIRMDSVAGFVTRRNATSGRPHDKVPRGMLGSVAKVIYWLLYYSPGYLVTTYPALRQSTLHLSHRYLLDALVDPRRYRYGGPPWLLRLAWRLAVKPDLVILLDAPPAVIQARKRELSAEETARQCVAYRRTVAALPNGRIVDAARPADAVISDVRDVILDLMRRRTARRLRLESTP